MIGKLFGVVDSIFEDHLILNVAGVGYIVSCSAKTLSKAHIKTEIALIIETFVRELSIQLYGFLEEQEKQCFSILLNIKGVGPKMALNILSVFTPEELLSIIAEREVNSLKRVSGLGKKLAERIIAELHGHVSKLNIGSYHSKGENPTNIILDATSALINLGINRNDAENIVYKIHKQNPETSLDQLIVQSLKQLS